jgi:Zn-dependent peptidase ImmA (M78 family)
MGKLPKSVNVLGQKIKVTYKIPTYLSLEEQEEVKLCYGVYLPDYKVIWINKKLPIDVQWSSLFHEIGHAILNRNGLRFSKAIKSDIEEVVVETFGNTYYELAMRLKNEER